MARFTLAKKRPPSHGWKPELLALAREKYGDFDPSEITHEEFIEQLVEHHLAEIHQPYETTDESRSD